MDHVEINQEQLKYEKEILIDLPAENLSSPSLNPYEDLEALFWCNMLYAIGSHIIDNAKIIPNDSINTDDPLSKIFCGYWVLYNIATIATFTELNLTE